MNTVVSLQPYGYISTMGTVLSPWNCSLIRVKVCELNSLAFYTYINMFVNYSKHGVKNNNLKLDGHLSETVTLLHIINDSLIDNVQ